MPLWRDPPIALLAIAANGIHQVETVFLLLLALVIAFALIARRLKTPYPIVLLVAGLVLGFIPGIPRVSLDPNVIFLVVLPPLLYRAAWHASWREFRFNLLSIALLAFGLVGFTVLGVTLVAPRVFTGFDWRLGFVLGAVVATTDAIAATSIAQRIGLPGQIVSVLEGESLLNDATGLLMLEFATAMLVSGKTPGAVDGLLRLVWLTVGGLAAGLFLGFLIDRFERRLEHASIETILSIMIPYGTYLAAESIHASGVLAVVVCGLFLSRRSAEFFSPQVRLQANAVWDSLDFALNSLAFILIGLQLPYVLAGIQQYSRASVFLDGAIFSALLILLRLIWIFPGAWLSFSIRRRVLHQQVELPSARRIFVVGWTGMRGVIALAAALSLPATLANGQPFPQRNLIVFLTFCVILVTLALQGLTLPWLIRLLGLAGAADSSNEECKARQAVLQAALSHLEKARAADRPEWSGVYDHLALHYRTRLIDVQKGSGDESERNPVSHAKYQELLRDLVQIERQTALHLRNQGRINDEVLRRLEREFDLSELRLNPA
jgi:monovalent cation/hydrogen antiporter